MSLITRVTLLLIGSAAVSASAIAVIRKDYLFVTNSYGAGEYSQRFEFDDYGGGGTYPCLTNRADQDWSPGASGSAWGIAKNWSMNDAHDWLYASIRSPNGSGGCAAGAGKYCFGAARIDLSAGSYTRSWNTNQYMSTAPQAVDVLGNNDKIIVANKADDSIYEHNYSNGAIDHVTTDVATDSTQLEWLDGDFFVATMAGNTKTAGNCPGAGPTWDGEVWIGQAGVDGPIDTVTVGGVNSGSKPEGVTVADIDGAHSASCTAGADSVVYVADYCQSRLYVYTVDLDAASPVLTYETDISLQTDHAASASTVSGDCEPSSAAYYDLSGNVMVVCQTRASLMKIHTSADQCAPSWTSQSDEVQLQKYDDTAAPTCSNNPDTDACGTECQPHDIAWDPFIWPGWLFINLSGIGEVLAIKDDLTNQRILYRDPSNFTPQELDLAASCNPTDGACVYP